MRKAKCTVNSIQSPHGEVLGLRYGLGFGGLGFRV